MPALGPTLLPGSQEASGCAILGGPVFQAWIEKATGSWGVPSGPQRRLYAERSVTGGGADPALGTSVWGETELLLIGVL